MKKMRWQFTGHVIMAGIVVSVIGAISAFPLMIIFAWYHWWTILLSFGLYALEVVALYGLYRHYARVNHLRLPALSAKIAPRTVAIAAVAVVLLILVALGNSVLMSWLHQGHAENQLIIDRMMKVHPVPLVIGACVFGPMCEELTFRGIFASATVFGPYQRTGFMVVTYLISSLLFGVAHTGFSDFGQLLYYTLFGLIVGATYWLSGRDIRVNTAVHMLANFILTLI